jgi:hypothetical protein
MDGRRTGEPRRRAGGTARPHASIACRVGCESVQALLAVEEDSLAIDGELVLGGVWIDGPAADQALEKFLLGGQRRGLGRGWRCQDGGLGRGVTLVDEKTDPYHQQGGHHAQEERCEGPPWGATRWVHAGMIRRPCGSPLQRKVQATVEPPCARAPPPIRFAGGPPAVSRISLRNQIPSLKSYLKKPTSKPERMHAFHCHRTPPHPTQIVDTST